MNCPVCSGGSIRDGVTLGKYLIDCCARCGLRFAPDAFDAPTDYSAVYESESYRETQVIPIASVADKRVFAEIGTYQPFFRNVPFRHGMTLLDVGCGVGRFLHGAHSKGWTVEGIDISSTAITVGQRYATFPMSVKSLSAVAESGKRYDVVTLFEVLEHLSEPSQILEQSKRVLQPNGSVFCTVPNWECSAVQKATDPAWIPPIHLLFYSENSLRELARTVGLKVNALGFIHTDSFPVNPHFNWPVRALRWAGRRLRRIPNEPIGIWMHLQLV